MNGTARGESYLAAFGAYQVRAQWDRQEGSESNAIAVPCLKPLRAPEYDLSDADLGICTHCSSHFHARPGRRSNSKAILSVLFGPESNYSRMNFFSGDTVAIAA